MFMDTDLFDRRTRFLPWFPWKGYGSSATTTSLKPRSYALTSIFEDSISAPIHHMNVVVHDDDDDNDDEERRLSLHERRDKILKIHNDWNHNVGDIVPQQQQQSSETVSPTLSGLSFLVSCAETQQHHFMDFVMFASAYVAGASSGWIPDFDEYRIVWTEQTPCAAFVSEILREAVCSLMSASCVHEHEIAAGTVYENAILVLPTLQNLPSQRQGHLNVHKAVLDKILPTSSAGDGDGDDVSLINTSTNVLPCRILVDMGDGDGDGDGQVTSMAYHTLRSILQNQPFIEIVEEKLKPLEKEPHIDVSFTNLLHSGVVVTTRPNLSSLVLLMEGAGIVQLLGNHEDQRWQVRSISSTIPSPLPRLHCHCHPHLHLQHHLHPHPHLHLHL